MNLSIDIFITSSQKNGYFGNTDNKAMFQPEICKEENITKIGILIRDDIKQAYTNLNNDIFNHIKSETDYPFTLDNTITNNKELEDLVVGDNYLKESRFCFVIDVQQFNKSTDQYKFGLRFDSLYLPNTFSQPYFPKIIPWDWETDQQMYYNSSILNVMSSLTSFILMNKNQGANEDQFNLAFLPMKTPGYTVDVLAAVLLEFVPVVFLFTYLMPLLVFVYLMSEEKEKKLKSMMKIMGLKEFPYVLSWFIIYLASIVLVTIILVLILSFNVLPHAQAALLFLFLFLYGLSQFGVMLLAVNICTTMRSTSLLVTMFNLISYFAQEAVQNLNRNGISVFQNWMVCLLPTAGLNIGTRNIVYMEAILQGFNLSNINLELKNFAISTGLIMLSVDSVLYLLIALYISKVFPQDSGQREKWYFCLTKDFYTRSNKRKKNQKTIKVDDNEQNTVSLIYDDSDYLLQEEEEKQIEEGNFERPILSERTEKDLNDTLTIKNLTKVFSKGKPSAVNSISVSIFKGQIFALLGHNGAGKTTTINMLTGLVKATSGSIKGYGIDLLEDLESLQEILGVCQQEDILFDNLTVEEHLIFYSCLKNVPKDEQMASVNYMIEDLNLQKQRSQYAKTLSGGQKRKLSAAIALIGDSKLILLDEPTSGMDPTARREMWDILKKYKKDRIIILTTHYMDEADILGDRIAIMQNGVIKCCGSSLFLKNKFGVGYLLEVQRLDNQNQQMENLENLLRQKLGSNSFQIQESQPSYIIYQLSYESSEHFKDIFELIDENPAHFNIDIYELRVTTLEEVFLKIGEGQGSISSNTSANHHSIGDSVSNINDEFSLQENISVWKQAVQVFKRRNMIQRREKKLMILELIFPILYLCFGFLIASLNFQSDYPSIRLDNPDSQLSPPSVTLIYNKNPVINTSQQAITPKQFMKDNNYSEFSRYNTQEIDILFPDNFNQSLQLFDDQVQMKKTTQKYENVYGNYLIYNIEEKKVEVVIYNNASSYIAVPLYANKMLQHILRYFTKSNDLNLAFSIDPLPYTQSEKSVQSLSQGFAISIFIAASYQMISAAIVQTLIRERNDKVKQQLQMNGVTTFGYWLGNYMQELLTHGLVQGFSWIYIKIFKINADFSYLLFFLFVISNPVFIYFWVSISKKESTGSVTIRLIYIFFGAIFPFVCIAIPNEENQDSVLVSKIIALFLMIIPIFSLTYGILTIANRSLLAYVQHIPKQHPLSFASGGITIPYFIASTILFGVLGILIDKGKICKKNTQKKEKDESDLAMDQYSEVIDQDVLNEEQRISNQRDQQDIVTVLNLQKTYITSKKHQKNLDEIEQKKQRISQRNRKKHKKKYIYRAVKDISFGVKQSECFVLLGVNGAGKTSTFKCLLGEIRKTRGQVFLDGEALDVYGKDYSLHQRLIGYCPQYDPLTPQLTVEEHLRLFMIIKGYKQQDISKAIDQTLSYFELVQYRKTQAYKLSGGNKRKLSTAIALLGKPKVIFLDEQSSGVDPASRRKIWKVIKQIGRNSAMIVTTHLLEEAEALASKLGIMVNGQFKCFGNIQHIKEKYGQGYEIQIKIDIDRVGNPNIPKNINFERISQSNEEIKANEKDQMIKQLKDIEKQEDLSIIDQFNEQGTLRNFYLKAMSEGKLDLKGLLQTAYIQKEILALYFKFQQKFKDVVLLDQSQNYVQIRVSKDNKSIGFMFGYIEELKNEFPIKEFSVSQTTLEQIFNGFAKQEKLRTMSTKLDLNSIKMKSIQENNQEFLI